MRLQAQSSDPANHDQVDRLVYKSTLIAKLGFTKRALTALGTPDKLVINQNHRSGPKAALYSVFRAETFRAQHPELFLTADARAAAKDRAAKAVTTKKAKLQRLLDQHPLQWLRELPDSLEELKRQALEHAKDRYGSSALIPGDDGVIATVRHEYTNYEYLLQLLEGKVGGKDAYADIKFELNCEIEHQILEKYGKVIHTTDNPYLYAP